MGEAPTGILDGTVLVYTYPEMGTVRVSFDSGTVGFEWLAGPLEGEAGEGFAYRARALAEDRFFVNWHEPDARGFVTLHVDLGAESICSSVLAAYATDEAQILFHEASIDRVERSGG